MSIYLCANCNHKFNDRASMCIDWADEKQKFACPNCKTALAVLDKPLLPRGSFQYYVSIVLLLIVIPAGMTLVEYFTGLNISKFELFNLAFNLKSSIPLALFIYFLLIASKPVEVIKTRLHEGKPQVTLSEKGV